ncbi:protein-glutamate methylesterase/protein-glutamine glutaminase [Neptuniibacter sp.]|uniref:protein-glutamate methylesterase/protein-glutamine glutaminase n=1 Tax=Neptuniibacter sp. TaxID=1962643 RepID=UPI003B5AD1C6
MEKHKVLIVDDSAVVRKVLMELLSSDPEIEVVATAVDPYDARDKIKEFRPDVLTLDIEMPKMDGITFLRNLMKLNPMPVVMLSSLTHKGAEATLQALELGAVDFMPKPTMSQSDGALKLFQDELRQKVKIAASSAKKLKFIRPAGEHVAKPVLSAPVGSSGKYELIAVGASTGGTEALRDVLEVLPQNLPPIVVTQHIPASFSERFANRLNTQCAVSVQQLKEGDILKPGHVYIAPGGHHFRVKKQGNMLMGVLDDREPVNRHKPSVEVMFDSLLDSGVTNAISIMLTGMGDDGALAMKRLQDAGVHTIAQDEQSSLVWGMPGMAVKHGGVQEVLALNKISERLIQILSGK